MVFRWMINAGLLALPIGATVGILMGLDMHRGAAGQAPLFTPEPGNSKVDGGGKGSKGDNRVKESTYCQVQVGISPPSNGHKYTLNPNQWGYTPGTPGSLCMNVTAFYNGTYATPNSAPEFSVTWQYPPGPETQPVHAFPNIQVGEDDLPVKLSTLQHMYINTEWTYGVGNDVAASTDVAALAVVDAQSNVAIDMFIDASQKNAKDSTKAAYEVMVWLGTFGAAAEPIGLKNGTLATEVVNGTTFDLYTGVNGQNQNVYTWKSTTLTEKFQGDIAPLLVALTKVEKTTFPLQDLYLGHLGMGSEAFSAAENITLSMPVFAIDIQHS